MEVFMKAVEAHAATMVRLWRLHVHSPVLKLNSTPVTQPETAIVPDQGLSSPSPGPLNSVGLANSAAGAAGALAGWAMTSLTKKVRVRGAQRKLPVMLIRF